MIQRFGDLFLFKAFFFFPLLFHLNCEDEIIRCIAMYFKHI